MEKEKRSKETEKKLQEYIQIMSLLLDNNANNEILNKYIYFIDSYSFSESEKEKIKMYYGLKDPDKTIKDICALFNTENLFEMLDAYIYLSNQIKLADEFLLPIKKGTIREVCKVLKDKLSSQLYNIFEKSNMSIQQGFFASMNDQINENLKIIKSNEYDNTKRLEYPSEKEIKLRRYEYGGSIEGAEIYLLQHMVDEIQKFVDEKKKIMLLKNEIESINELKTKLSIIMNKSDMQDSKEMHR